MSADTSISLQGLPQECLLAVLQHCAVRDWQSCACACKQFGDLVKDDGLWKRLAETKWGHRVRALDVAPGGWQPYCTHRMSSVSVARSPLGLLQEQFADPWAHIACCLLASRTTGGAVVREAVAAFLRRYPSPSALLDAPRGEALAALRPVGLQEQRYAALAAMSEGFLESDWRDPSEFKGCGRFTSDSWRIFCRGERSAAGVEDANLRRYLRWLNSGEVEAKGGAAAGGGRARKSKEERPALPGVLRSGRRRGAGGPAEGQEEARAARPRRSCTVRQGA